jgi:hypothetical protein
VLQLVAAGMVHFNISEADILVNRYGSIRSLNKPTISETPLQPGIQVQPPMGHKLSANELAELVAQRSPLASQNRLLQFNRRNPPPQCTESNEIPQPTDSNDTLQPMVE